jgi:hypothetical protein
MKTVGEEGFNIVALLKTCLAKHEAGGRLQDPNPFGKKEFNNTCLAKHEADGLLKGEEHGEALAFKSQRLVAQPLEPSQCLLQRQRRTAGSCTPYQSTWAR